MLILKRRPREVVCVGSTHRVTVMEVQNHRARVRLKVEQLPSCDCELKGFEMEVTLGIGETHDLAPDLDVTVLGIKGNQVRLGFNGPQHVAIGRAEVRERKDAGLPPPSAAR